MNDMRFQKISILIEMYCLGQLDRKILNFLGYIII